MTVPVVLLPYYDRTCRTSAVPMTVPCWIQPGTVRYTEKVRQVRSTVQRKYDRYGQRYRESTTGTVRGTEKVRQVRSAIHRKYKRYGHVIHRKYNREVAGKKKYDDWDQISLEW